jgi:hypothetical protein
MSNLLIPLCVLYFERDEWGLHMVKGDLTRGERLQIMLSPEELETVDDFRFRQRMPSRAAAVRELFRLGLASVGLKPAEPGTKSGSFGVFDRGPDGHHRGNGGPAKGASGARSKRGE